LLAAPGLFAQTARVPFVGCAQDGQAGPVDAPKEIGKTVKAATSAAKRLAFYATADGFGALAPRGWYCFGIYGSSGGSLFISSRPIKIDDLFRRTEMEGPVVELDATEGGGSGTADVAEVWARVFPQYWPIVKGLIKNGDLPAEYAFGPYPDDKLLIQRARLVRFRTPPHSEGLGTRNRLKANDDPIDGVAILEGRNPDLLMLRVRLPRELRDLASVIIQDLLIRQRSDTR
jgi:hypothetical protein